MIQNRLNLRLFLSIAGCFILFVAGCGEAGNEVIAPSGPYELTPQEEANLKITEELRGTGGDRSD